MQITSAASVTTMATRREKGTFGPTRRIQVVPHSSEEDEEKGLHYISLAGFFLSLFFLYASPPWYIYTPVSTCRVDCTVRT